MRLSLGATRARLARQVLVEALCLSVAGGVLGLAIPVVTSTLIERIVPAGLQGLNVSVLDWRLLSFAAVLSIVTGVLFSLGPAVQSAHASTAEVLQQHARGNIGGSARRFRDGLVVLQVAATLVLLVGAGLMLRTLANLNAIELGFDAEQSADDAGGAAAGEVCRAGHSVWRSSIAWSARCERFPAFTRRRLPRRSHFKRPATRGSLPSRAGRLSPAMCPMRSFVPERATICARSACR